MRNEILAVFFLVLDTLEFVLSRQVYNVHLV